MARHEIEGFEKRLRDTILGSGKSATRIAADMHIDRRLVHRWISGETYPTAGLLMEICRYFGVSADWLLGLKGRKTSK